VKNVAFVYLNNDKVISVGAGYIATIIKNLNYNLTFFDTAYESVDTVALKILAGYYDIVLISASTLFYEDMVKLSKTIKQSNPIPILIGGIHATIAKEKVLEDCSYIDYICVGEGEDFIVDFLTKYDTLEFLSIPNLGYREASGTVKINPIRKCTDLATLPMIEHKLFDKQSIVLKYPIQGFSYVYATRGCPYNCTYCCNGYFLSLYGKDFLRVRKTDDVIKELKYLRDNYDTKLFYFGDEMILFNIPYVTELFTRIKEELNISYGCMVRVETIKPEIVELFRNTGCRYVGMGIECGDEPFRKEFLNRHMTNKQIIEAFKELRTIDNIMLTSFNMTGYPVPYDARLTEATVRLNKIITPNIIQTTVFFPFPGTKLYKYCIENDLIDLDKAKNLQNVFSTSVLKDSLFTKESACSKSN
jgi:radical SAM superfamily enzyme YgiQ (UPF0313 family)